MERKRTIEDLQYLQGLPLSSKVALTKDRIREWYEYFGGKIYVSFSGGKDSTALLHIARQMYPDVKAVFVNTGLEFPEVVRFTQSIDNVETIRPKRTFIQVIEESGYPLFSKEISETLTGGVKYLNELVKREIAGGNDRSEMKNAPYMTDMFGIDRRGGLKMNNPPCVAMKFGAIPSEILFSQPPEVLNQIQYDGDTISNVNLQEETVKHCKASRYSRENYQFALFAPFNISKRCCRVLKKSPIHIYWSKTKYAPMTAQTASESAMRAMQWLHNGCNLYEGEFPISNPMSFWTEQDVLLYLYMNHIPIASVYGEITMENSCKANEESFADFGLFDEGRPLLHTTGCERTGCFACLFGAHMEKEESSRFKNIQKNSNPKLLDWMLRGGEFRKEDDKWHPKNGLGYWFIMEWCNKFGKMKFWYPNRDYYIEKYSTPETDYWLKNDKFASSEGVIKILLQDLKDKIANENK